MKILAIIGALIGFFSVTLGAFGAHFLKSKLSSEMLQIFEVAVRYQFYHALALLMLVGVKSYWNSINVMTPGICFVLGVIIFSGSLYILSFTGQKMWGAITPVGGLFFLVGWALLVWQLIRS